MVKYTITPWRSHTDLLTIRTQLYSKESPPTQRHAINRVMAWKLRTNLPHAIESTALLIDALLHHHSPPSTSVSIFSIRAVYSAAFTRFVTGFCDIGRNKERSLEPSSMVDIAKQIGMPVEFVALRHEATHEELPGVKRLVKAVEEGLEWLWRVYWSRLEEVESEEVVAKSLEGVKAEAKGILKGFRTARREALRSKKGRQQGEEVQSACKSCLELVGSSNVKMQAVTDALVEERLLVPSKRELGAPLQGAYLIWDPLLEGLINERRRFLTALVSSLQQAIYQSSSTQLEEDADGEAASLWLLHAISYANAGIEQEDSRRDVMIWCCTHPGYWSYHVGQQLIKASNSEFREDWQDMLEASQLSQETRNSSADVDMEETDRIDSSAVLEIGGPGQEPSMIGSSQSSGIRGWTRAATARKLPSGVVR